MERYCENVLARSVQEERSAVPPIIASFFILNGIKKIKLNCKAYCFGKIKIIGKVDLRTFCFQNCLFVWFAPGCHDIIESRDLWEPMAACVVVLQSPSSPLGTDSAQLGNQRAYNGFARFAAEFRRQCRAGELVTQCRRGDTQLR